MALLRAAEAAGVERCVYTSSVAALGLTADGTPADETTLVKPAHHIGAYKRSKYDAEQAVRALAAAGQNIVIVNPSTPVGPGDVKPTPTGQMVLDAARGKMPAFVDTGLNIVHVDDVAAGHVLALEKGVAGEAYILGSENLMLRELLAMIAAQTGRRAPSLRLPIAPLMPMAWVCERIAEMHRQAAGDDAGDPRHGAQEDVFLRCQGRARAGLCAAPGGGGGGGCVGVVPGRGEVGVMAVSGPADLAVSVFPARAILGIRAGTAPRPCRWNFRMWIS